MWWLLSCTLTLLMGADKGERVPGDEADVIHSGVKGLWSPPEPLLQPGGEVTQRQTAPVWCAMGSNGDALVAWVDKGTSFPEIWANRFTADGGWHGAVRLGGAENTIVGLPRVAMNGRGDGICIWLQGAMVNGTVNDGHFAILCRQYRRGASWGRVESVRGEGVTAASWPEIAMDGHGNALAVWYEARDELGNRSAMGSYREMGGTWQEARRLEGEAQTWVALLRCAMSENGEGVAVWFDRNLLMGCLFKKNDGWGQPEIIADEGHWPGEFGSTPSVAMDGMGNATVFWIRGREKTHRLLARTHVSNVGWKEPRFVTSEKHGAIEYAISINALGEAAVVWREYCLEGAAVYMAMFSRETGWSGEHVVDDGNQGWCGYPIVNLGLKGGVMLWARQRVGQRSLYASVFEVGGAFGVPQQLDSVSGENAGIVSHGVVMDCEVRALAVWSRHSSQGREDVRASRFNLGGPRP